MRSDGQLQADVMDELSWEPRVDSQAVAVSVHDGVVTLRGTVGTPRERHEARKAAERVFGAPWVVNDIDVRLLDEDRRDDAELRGDVLHALTLNALAPMTVDAHVKDGVVTLDGSVSWQFERDEAENLVANVPGVTGVRDEIELTGPRPDAPEVRQAIQKAFRRNAKLDADSIEVETTNGAVSLTGTVRSWSEHDAALAAAWAAPVCHRSTTTSPSATDPSTRSSTHSSTRSSGEPMVKSISTALLWRGILAIAIGVVSVAWPQITIGAVVILFAVYAFMVAVADAARGFSSQHAGPVIGFLLLGLLSLAAGVVALAWPGITALRPDALRGRVGVGHRAGRGRPRLPE